MGIQAWSRRRRRAGLSQLRQLLGLAVAMHRSICDSTVYRIALRVTCCVKVACCLLTAVRHGMAWHATGSAHCGWLLCSWAGRRTLVPEAAHAAARVYMLRVCTRTAVGRACGATRLLTSAACVRWWPPQRVSKITHGNPKYFLWFSPRRASTLAYRVPLLNPSEVSVHVI